MSLSIDYAIKVFYMILTPLTRSVKNNTSYKPDDTTQWLDNFTYLFYKSRFQIGFPTFRSTSLRFESFSLPTYNLQFVHE